MLKYGIINIESSKVGDFLKKTLKIFIFLFIFLAFKSNVFSYNCVYDFDYKVGLFEWFSNHDTVGFTMTDKTISVRDSIFDATVGFYDPYGKSAISIPELLKSLGGKCPSKVVVGVVTLDSVSGYAIFFDESNFYSLNKESDMLGTRYTLSEKFMKDTKIYGSILEENHATAYYNSSKSDADVDPSIKFPCKYYNDTIEKLEKLDCYNKKCTSSDIGKYNEYKNNLKTFCENVLSMGNIGVNSCITPCLGLNDYFKQKEASNVTCGFSDRLLVIINNILRWIKYILPVIVIILGILDFIKAISTDKEDEMKKAQKRFIIRLIAAALVFIVPLIITFILDKMGFTANSCGIDLF